MGSKVFWVFTGLFVLPLNRVCVGDDAEVPYGVQLVSIDDYVLVDVVDDVEAGTQSIPLAVPYVQPPASVSVDAEPAEFIQDGPSDHFRRSPRDPDAALCRVILCILMIIIFVSVSCATG